MKTLSRPFGLTINSNPLGNKRKELARKVPEVIELEESVLGALLIEQDALTDVIDILKPDSFFREQHRLIFKAIVKLFNQAEPVDPRTVVARLRKEGTLEQAGGTAYIASLINSVASATHIENHARIIVEYAMRRALIQVATQIQHDAYDETVETFDLLDRSEQALFDVSENNIKKSYADVGALMGQAIKELKEKKHQGDGLTGVPTGFVPLDRLLMGWQKSDFVVIAARPGMGKTAFMLTLLRNAAVDHGVPVAFFSLEMSSVQLVNRMISSEASLSSEKIKKGKLEPYEWEQLYHKTSKLNEAPIFIDDTPALSLFEFRAKCRRLRAQKKVEVIFVDYLQLMVDGTSRHTGNREQQVAAISRGIKAIAKELDVTIVVASQLSRSVETRGGDKRPQLSDLRESGSIEQDADIVMFLYRGEYYGLTEDEEGRSLQNTAEVIIAKHRNGPTDKVLLNYIGEHTKFTDLTQGYDLMESKINFSQGATSGEEDDLPFI